MKKILTFSLLCLFSLLTTGAEEVQIKDKELVVNHVSHTGLLTTIRLNGDFVKKQWKTYLKQFGKISSNQGQYELPEATISGINQGGPVQIFTSVKDFGSETEVFWAFMKNGEYLSAGSNEHDKAKHLLYQFAITCYRENILNEIEIAEKALMRTVRDQEKSISEGDQIHLNLSRNEERKVKLENELAETETEKITLDSLQQVNQLDQAQKELQVQQMQQALELVRNKLKEIE